MTSSRPLLPLSALLFAGALAGCDHEPVDDEPLDADRVAAEPPNAELVDADRITVESIDAHVVGHLDLGALMSAPWLSEAMKDATLAMDAKLGPCADVLRQADSVTFGAKKEEAFEAYVVGSFDAAAANACGDRIDAEVDRHATRLHGHPRPEAVLLADGVFVVFGGDLTPSRDRLARLHAADPSSGQPLWVAANMAGSGRPVEQVRAWANPARGLHVHAKVVFADEQKAAEVYGKANLGLAAMSMSSEVGELSSAVDLRSNGREITANVELTDEQMKTVVAKGKARHHARHAHDGVRVEIDAD
ncbi:hypothetical protein [Paraliomyxa miuraensis]|uniref:hypothetical protein n=1 Tax=Paraliomyxa miuraensis TaxID=376150 RepID=UPI002258BCBC|nr:hypothetical protein [Paraliomyxa miuraensis]MCX4245524.1 hypothetical protein [Paraliomyxa miuraensis]